MILNKAWHAAHPMPERPSRDQRIRWHVAHAKACACRPAPASLREGVEKVMGCQPSATNRTEEHMQSEPLSELSPCVIDDPLASRRDFVAAAVTVAAAAGASAGAETAQAQGTAQGTAGVRFLNPAGMQQPATYSHVVEVNGPHRAVYIAGQTGVDASGKLADGFRAQAVQVMENIKTALAAVGGNFDHVVKMNAYLTDIGSHAQMYREVRDNYLNKAARPAATLVQVVRLAQPGYLIEVEAIAVLPAKA
jgi:enamine deaminase RidA (YjgF/YER057c/UK114 family)